MRDNRVGTTRDCKLCHHIVVRISKQRTPQEEDVLLVRNETQVVNEGGDVGRPPGPPDPLAAELAGWTAGELPGQASQQLANWAAAESAPARTVGRTRDRSRTVR